MPRTFDPGKPRVEYVELGKLKKWPKNPKGHDLAFLGDAYRENGFAELPHIDEGTGRMVAGHGRVEKLVAMQAAGEEAPERIEVRDGKWFVPVVRGMRYRKPAKHVLASNRGVELGGWTDELAGFLASIGQDDLLGTGYTEDDFAAYLTTGDGTGAGSLAEKFLVPPFSVLDARQGYWQERKRAWLALGIKSELGRVAPIGGGPMPLDRVPKGGGGIPANVQARGSHAQAHRRLRGPAAASPGGSPRPAMKLRGGKTVRGDGAGREL